jgi:phage terminase large subunit-like protein
LEAVDLLTGDSTNVLLYGGSRSGKTFILLFLIVIRALKKKSRHLILRLHFNHAKTSIWLDTLPKVLAMACPGLGVVWNHSDYYVEFPNGSQVWIGGLDDKDRTEKVLGTEYATILFNECSQLQYDSVQTALTRLAEKSGLVNRALFDCNPPNRKHWAYKVFVLKQDPNSGLPLARPDLYGSLLMNPEDNRENLPEGYIETVLGGLSHRKQQRFRFGQWLDAVEGALWKDEDILHEAYPPNMERIVVAIDPAVTSNKSSDETGIVVAGIAQGRFYVLDDLGGRYSPLAWATKAVEAYRQWGADRVIGEANNGGDMIETTLRQVDPNVAYKSVHATRGKAVRAEPVAALYEQRRGVHCGQFPELEDQMTSWLPGDDGSPDRMDALVWAATELLLAPEEETQHVIVYEDETVISRY